MSTIMTKNQIITKIADETGLSKIQVNDVMTKLDMLARKEVKKVGQFRVLDLGKLKIRDFKARLGRNPMTGATIKIPARTRVKFVVSKAIKELVK
jgi:DNA-binding protein HU-beta